MVSSHWIALSVGLCVLCVASIARAHDPGMSSFVVSLEASGPQASLRIHERDAARLGDLTTFAMEALVLTIDGGGVPPEAISIRHGEDHVTASARYPRVSGALEVGAVGTAQLSRGHRQLVRIVKDDTVLASGLLAAGDPPLELAASVAAAPRPGSFVAAGLKHVLAGWDHLLFVTALLLASSSMRHTVRTVTAFTVAHSLTLAAASVGWLSLPSDAVEVGIAATIVIVGVRAAFGHSSWREATGLAFVFGLVHGLGFAGMLRALLGNAQEVVGPLLAFNVGVELGQLGVVLVAIVPLRFGLQHPKIAPFGVPVAGLAIAGMGVVWMFERAHAAA